MKQVSNLMRDQFESPVQRAVYWIEYVIRHRGVHHLRSPTRDLSVYQQSLIDVIVFLVLIAFLMAYVILRLCRLACSSLPKYRWQVSEAKKNN